MKKIMNKLSVILFVITIILGVLSFVFYYTPFKNYLIVSTFIVLIITLANIISEYRLSKHIKKTKLYENRLGLWNTISYRVKKSGEHAFNDLPIGIVILSKNYETIWSNEYAKNIFMSDLNNILINNIQTDIYNNIKQGIKKFNATIYGDIYEIEFDEKYLILYLTNITEIMAIKKQYDNKMTAFGYINVDNLENVISDMDVQERAEFMFLIVSEIAKWALKFGAYVRAYSDNSYLLLMEKTQLKKMMEDNFSILDSIKTLGMGKTHKISLSMGISCGDDPINDLAEQAKSQLEFALNRGGDQATVMIDNHVRFFGAKDDTAQAVTKVTMRMKAEELKELMKSSSDVFVVGHKVTDADAFGATLAIYRMAKSLGINSYIVLDKTSMDPTVTRVLESIHTDYVGLLESIVSPTQAISRMSDNSLLMVVDCQQVTQLSEPKLVKKASKIGVIDHHRRGDETIDNICFYLSSTAASSSVELIVQLYEFLDEEIEFDKLEATWLLLGIIVDTNNFVYRCSEKTFKVASILAKYGANMTGVKKFLKEEISEKILRNELIDNLETFQNHVGIAKGSNNVIFKRSQLAKISDEIISVVGIDVGITVGKISNNQIGISARSLGNVNVQLLMERFNGGGHFNNAAAQVDGDDIDIIVKRLKQYVDEYIEKEEYMKVILTKDIKGHGKKNEIIDFNLGFANHLIRSGQAIAVTDENLKRLDEQKKQLEIEEEKRLNELKELQKVIEVSPIKIAVKVGSEGRLFGSVNSKQIVDAFLKETGRTLNKQDIKLDKNIASLGTYKIPIDLHKSIKTHITLYVVEKE